MKSEDKKCFTFLQILQTSDPKTKRNTQLLSAKLPRSARTSSPITTTKTPKQTGKTRVAVITYIGASDQEVQIFLTMLYGSWRYIADHNDEFFGQNKPDILNHIDLIAFCLPKICHKLKPYCTVVEGIASIPDHTSNDATDNLTCWAVEHSKEITISYPALYSYGMFNRTDISLLVPRYKYLMRTDYDVFLSPTILWYKTDKKLTYGEGGYSMPFNMHRLKAISAKLGLIHRNFYNIGSTWFGKTDVFMKAGRKMLEIIEYLYLNEFQPHLEGLEIFELETYPDGRWPHWYRPVCTMYAGEIVINHFLEDLSINSKEPFDSESCSGNSIWSTVHIHCWQTDCEFNKYNFTRYLSYAIHSVDSNLISGEVLHNIMENMYPKNIFNMTIQQYATHIAWNSAVRYLGKWILNKEMYKIDLSKIDQLLKFPTNDTSKN